MHDAGSMLEMLKGAIMFQLIQLTPGSIIANLFRWFSIDFTSGWLLAHISFCKLGVSNYQANEYTLTYNVGRYYIGTEYNGGNVERSKDSK